MVIINSVRSFSDECLHWHIELESILHWQYKGTDFGLEAP
jgi:hypothetical protein